MNKTSDHDVVPGASESDSAARMLAEAYKRVPAGQRDFLPTIMIDRRQVLQAAMLAAPSWSPAVPPVSEPVSEPGTEQGLHRRRGVKARLHMARTVRVRARRVLGAAAVIGAVTGLCLAAVMGLTHSGNSGIPSYHKSENPFLHTNPATPNSGTGAVGNRRPPRSASLGLGVPVSARTASAPLTQPVSQAQPVTSSPRTSPTPSASASPSSSPSPTPSASPSASASSSPTPSASPSASASSSPTPSASPSASASPSSTHTSAAVGSSLPSAEGLPASNVRLAHERATPG
jgi:hypothetical protein